MMSTRVITPPTMDLPRDTSQACPDAPPSVVAIPDSGEGMPVGATESAVGTVSGLGCPSPASSPNSSSRALFSSTMGSTTELILSTKIRSVPRCLFGPPDPRTAQFARDKVREMYEQDKTRYNFDFDAEKPLNGPMKWEAVPIARTSTSTGNYAPKAYSLSRLPYLSGSMGSGRALVTPPPRTTINNNDLPPTRQLYFEPEREVELDREPLLIVRSNEEERTRITSTAISSSIMKQDSREWSRIRHAAPTATSDLPTSQSVTLIGSHTQFQTSASVLDPAVMLIPSPEASSCSSEDYAAHEMELEEEDVATSVDSSSTEEEIKISLASKPTSAVSTVSSTTLASSSNSGFSRLISASASGNSCCTRRNKSVSSSSSSPSASPSSPTSSQPPITRFMPTMRNKRPASTTTTKAASESAPASSAAEPKRTAY